jgi:hypothetical protein
MDLEYQSALAPASRVEFPKLVDSIELLDDNVMYGVSVTEEALAAFLARHNSSGLFKTLSTSCATL